MARHLLVLNIGPVQGFIATARRTRDLWFGSQVLSEVSKAAAKSLMDAGAELIFPAPDADLAAGSPLNVANRVVAIADTADPAELLNGAADAARASWFAVAEAVRREAERVAPGAVREAQWRTQRDDVLETQWAWTVWGVEESFECAFGRLKRLEAARKNTRGFAPAALLPTDAEPGYGLPKSSLDGARETVLARHISPGRRRRLGLGEGEQLDCPGLVKRLCGGDPPERFTPIARIALDPWLQRLGADALGRLRDATEPLVRQDFASRVAGKTFRDFPYDAQLLLPTRIEVALGSELEKLTDADERDGIRRALEDLRATMKPLWERHGEPDPYVALLLADGDRMGELLDRAAHSGVDALDRLHAATRALADFADAVPGIVRAHRGQCIYAGGDDVLALLPLPGALACARTLYSAFAATLQPVALELGVEQGRLPTLSVGLAVQHCLMPLGELRALAQRAEKLAKGDSLEASAQRDALAVIVQTRSGAPLEFRDRWKPDDGSAPPDERLQDWAALIAADALPDKAPYDLRHTALELRAVLQALPEASKRELQLAEARRVIGRKRTDGGTRPLLAEHAAALLDAAGRLGLARLADELVVARWFAGRADEERPTEEDAR